MTPPLSDQTTGTLTLGGDLTVRRLGFGSMRITGEGHGNARRDGLTARIEKRGGCRAPWRGARAGL